MKTTLNKILTAFALMSSFTMPVFAAPVLPGIDTPGGIVLNVIISVFDIVAAIIIFFGAYKIALGFGGNKPEEQTKGVQMAVSGVMIKAITMTSALWSGSLTNGGNWDNINGVIQKLVSWIVGLGAALLVYGLIKMAIAFQNDDAGGRTKAFTQSITGALLVGISTILGTLPTGTNSWAGVSAPGTLDGKAGVATLFKGAFFFIGSAMILFGAVNLAQAFSKEEAEAKAVGTRWMVAGVIVMAIGTAAEQFITF